VRESSVAELAAVPKVTPKMAQKIYDHFPPPGRTGAEETPVVTVTTLGADEVPGEETH